MDKPRPSCSHLSAMFLSRSFACEQDWFQRPSVSTVVEIKRIKTMNRDPISPQAREWHVNAGRLLKIHKCKWCFGCAAVAAGHKKLHITARRTGLLVHREPRGSHIDFQQMPWCWSAYSGGFILSLLLCLSTLACHVVSLIQIVAIVVLDKLAGIYILKAESSTADNLISISWCFGFFSEPAGK